jgi:hypothetical protein
MPTPRDLHSRRGGHGHWKRGPGGGQSGVVRCLPAWLNRAKALPRSRVDHLPAGTSAWPSARPPAHRYSRRDGHCRPSPPLRDLAAQRPGVQRRSPAEMVNITRKLGALATCRCSGLNVGGFVRLLGKRMSRKDFPIHRRFLNPAASCTRKMRGASDLRGCGPGTSVEAAADAQSRLGSGSGNDCLAHPMAPRKCGHHASSCGSMADGFAR